MMFPLLLSSAYLFSLSHAHPQHRRQSSTPLDNVLIFDPPSDYTIPRTLYARTLQLQDDVGTLLATWENYGPNNNTFPYFPIYASTDSGQTWTERTRVLDQVNDWGLRYQPFLYQLPSPIGSFAAGTILLAGSSIPDDLSKTQLDLYASTDGGFNFDFVSHVARGGVALPNNGETPVWEPFLMAHDNKLIYYYSDQRDPDHGQKLVHQTSSDLLSWGEVVDDVAYDTYEWRPGMTTVSLLPNGSYFLTYEFYGAEEGGFAVYYRMSEDPLLFNQAGYGKVIRATDGSIPIGSPYNVWTPAGGDNGTIVVSCGGSSEVWVSKDLAETWERIATPEKASYTRSLLVENDERTILIVGAGGLGGENNDVTASTIDADEL